VMAKLSESIQAFMDKYSVKPDEIWLVPGGKQYAIMHKALQRIARDCHIMITVNVVEQLCNLEQGYAVVKAFGKMGQEFCESYGEASPKNNRNQYPLAMAQKRAEDRVILGLLSVYGDVYSEEEAENFQQPRQNPHVTRPDDIVETADYDENGEVIDNIPHAEPTQKLRVVDQRPLYEAIQKEALAIKPSKAFIAWMNNEETMKRVANFKPDWQAIFRGICKEHLADLREGEAATNSMRMTG
jgi:hypothetical protein